MNCKPGDLAVVVASDFPEHIGMLCLVLKHGVLVQNMWEWPVRFERRVPWKIEDSGEETLNRSGMFPDAWLRPIRDNDGEDEMLRIAGKPEMAGV